jgi:small-conductance mechanosensitive channel
MSNPWAEWWQQTQARFELITVRSVQPQLLALGVALLAAIALDRLLERRRAGWVGDSRLRAILWAAKLPLLVLINGYLLLVVFSVTGRDSYTLGRFVTLFWYIAGYMLLVQAVTLAMPRGQSRRIIRRVLLPLLAVVSILHVLGLRDVLGQWAGQWNLSLGAVSINAASLARAIGVFVFFWLIARLSRDLVLDALLPRTQIDPQLARSASEFLYFAVIIAGVWLALSQLGLELSNLTLFVSALTVGIGFGLQDVIKNLMGGIILLGEKHVRPNDSFRIAGQSGIVESIGLRSTLLRSADGTLVIIPNADLIVEKVSNLSDVRRLEIKISVSTEADPRQVERLLLDLAASQPNVVAEPAPAVLFQDIGQNSYDFVLYCFVSDRALVEPTASALRYAVVESLARQQIDMPYTRLGVHLHASGQPQQPARDDVAQDQHGDRMW